MAKSKGKIFGICRGFQFIATTLDARISQHIEDDLPQPVRHQAPQTATDQAVADQATAIASSWHEIHLINNDNPLFHIIGKQKFMVNSRHHQGLLLPHNKEIRAAQIIATSGDVIEAFTLNNQRGFAVQFHPEDMETWIGEKIMERMVEQTKKYSNNNKNPS